MIATSDYFEYISKGDQNLYVSLINNPSSNRFFLTLDSMWKQHCDHISKLPAISTKDSYFLAATFFLIAQRQIRDTYYLFLRRVSYDALLSFRVALESVLFGCRIATDSSLAEVWANKNVNQREFREKLRDAEYPADMPFKDEIKREIDTLNEYWAHPNVNYASQAINLNSNDITVYSYDHDDQMYNRSLFSFFENSYRCLSVIRFTMDNRFAVYLVSTDQSFADLKTQLDSLRYLARN